MQAIDPTARVWQRILDVRAGQQCFCCGDWTEGERAALDLYGPIARRDIAGLTLGQIGQSLDGRIATLSGDASKLSGPDGLTHLHRLRALVDGVVIGVKTALHDSPQLTVRLCEGANPARIVIDPRGRLPNDSPVLRPDGTRRIVIQAEPSVRAEGIEVIQLPAPEGKFHPEEIVKALHQAGLKNLLIEGGSFTMAKFLEAGLLDSLQVSVAPILIGSGPQGITTDHNFEKLKDVIRPTVRVFSLGSDVVFDCGLSSRSNERTKPQH